MQSDNFYMALALKQAKAAAARAEVPVGAVIVECDTGQVLAREGNRPIELRDPTAHAEILAIREVCRLQDNYRLPGCDLFVTLEPCTMCAAAISFARIRRLVFGAFDEKGGAVENGVRFFDQPTCHHRPGVVSGIEGDAAAELLKSFFAERRQNS